MTTRIADGGDDAGTNLPSTLQGSGLFGALDAATFEGLVRDVEQIVAEPGAVIVREGDPGDAAYVISNGTVQVFTIAEDGSTLVLTKLGPGAYFGEQALLPGRSGRRNASVRAHSRVVLLKIRKEIFQRVLAENHPLKERLLQIGEHQLQDRLIRQSRLFRSLELGAVETVGTEHTIDAGEILFREGDPADHLYVILSGTAAVYGQQEGQPLLLRRLSEGQCVGELALLSRSARTATVVAESALRVFKVSSEHFFELHARSPELREYMQSLERVYQLPRRGFVTQHTGRFLDRECITTLYHLLDGRKLAASRVVGDDIFNLELATGSAASPAEATVLRHEDGRVVRELRVSPNGTLLGLTAHGPWPELAELCLLILDGLPLGPEQLDSFRATGVCGLAPPVLVGDDTDIVCNCVQIDRGTIRRLIVEGCRRVDEVQQRTSCGTVCGGCIPLVLELLDQSEWTAAVMDDERTVAAGIRSLRLRPREGPVLSARAGQHVVVQAQVGGRWVQRPYTLSSASGETGFYEITVKREPHGAFSRWIFEQRQPGSAVRVSRPQGSFVWEPHMDPVVCLAAGIGITPGLAICRTIVRQGLPQTLHIHYSARRAEDFACVEELRAAAASHENIRLTLRQTAREGRVTDEDIRALAERYPNAWFFVCGPEEYLASVSDHLAASGVPPERVRVEVFVHSGDPAPVASTVAASRAATPAATPMTRSAASKPELDLLVAPEVPPSDLMKWTRARLPSGAWRLANSRLFEGRLFGRPLNPIRLATDRLVARIAGLDSTLPKDHLAVLGLIGEGTLRHQLQVFERLDDRYGANRRRAFDARRSGRSLAPSTPDGTTFTYAIPNMPLVKFEGPHAVNTGWNRAGDGVLLPVYVTKSPTALRKILSDDPTIDRGPLPFHYFQQVFGSPHITPDACRKAAGVGAGQLHGNATWESQRRLTLDIVGPPALALRVPGMKVALDEVTDTIESHIDAHPDQVVDVTELMSRIAYHIMIRATFGDIPGLSGLGATLREPMRRAFQYAADQLAGKRGGLDAFHAALADLNRPIGQMIAAVRRADAEGDLDEQQRASPVIRLILDGGQDESMDDAAVSSFVIAFVFGGHETTGFSMAWALYELGRNPDLRAAILEEIDAFARTRGGRPITLALYDERPYTHALIHELLRRHPPIHMAARTALRSGEIPPDPETGIGAFRYRKDTLFIGSIFAAHMDPETYPEPDAFRIERFLAGITPEMPPAQRGRQVQANARRLEETFRLLPFSAGPGSCVGRGFNTLEVFMVLDHLLQRFSFDLEDPGREVTAADVPISGPAPGELRARIRRR